MTLVQGYSIPLVREQQFCVISRSNINVESNGRDIDFTLVHYDPDLEDMSMGQGRDTPLGHEQQSPEISKSNMTVRSYGPDTDFPYVCIVTLTFKIRPWVNVMTYRWIMDNNCVKYYPSYITVVN